MPKPLARRLRTVISTASLLVTLTSAHTSLASKPSAHLQITPLETPLVGIVPFAGESRADAPPTDKPETKRHPLKGVVVDVYTDKQALLIKHEEIPGVMRAMTMLLKVEPAALAVCKKGDAVTGYLVRKADGWWVEDVKAVK